MTVKCHSSLMPVPVCHRLSLVLSKKLPVDGRNSEHPLSLKQSSASKFVVTALLVFWQVNPIPYYESCISDFCGCDSVGDCECFCTSVAAYSRSCSRAGVCVDWRTPAICRKYCSENAHGKTVFHAPRHMGERNSDVAVPAWLNKL